MWPSLTAHLLTQPGLARTTCTHSRLVSPKCTVAHARFVRRYAHFESTIPNSPPIQPHESALIDTSLVYDDQAQQLECQVLPAQRGMAGFTGGWKRIPNTIASPVAYFQKIDSDSSAWGKAVAIVDASHTHVFSYLWNLGSFEHMNRHAEREGQGALNKVVFPPESHSMLRANIVNFGLAVSARLFSTWFVWRQEPDKSFTVAFAPTSDLQHQDLEKLRLELHELCYRLDDAVETKLDTQHLEEQIAQLRALIESIGLRDGAILSVENALSSNAAAAEAIRGTVKGFWRIEPLATEGKQAAERAREQRARPPA